MWFLPAKKIVCRLIVKPSGRGEEFDEIICEEMLKKEAVDWLFWILGVFTYLYLAALAFAFFQHLEEGPSLLFFLLDALQEPYLGAVGVYVILKEIRKRRRSHPSLYLGEIFVLLWLVLFLVAALTALFSPNYRIDASFKIILVNSLAVAVIYIGSIINRP